MWLLPTVPWRKYPCHELFPTQRLQFFNLIVKVFFEVGLYFALPNVLERLGQCGPVLEKEGNAYFVVAIINVVVNNMKRADQTIGV